MCESLLHQCIDKDNILINGFSAGSLLADKPENVRNGGVSIKERCDLEILPETIVAIDS